MNDLPRWSLDTIYPSVDSPEFSDDLDKVRSLASALAAEPDLALFDELTALMVNLDAYVSALISTDSENEAYLKALSAVEDAEVMQGLHDHFNGECTEVGMYLAMSRQAEREGYPEIAEAFKRYAFEEAEHAAKFAELLGEVVWDTKTNLEKRAEAECGACEGKLAIATRAKQLGYDAIHDTVHEMAKDEARHGAGFQGLLKRYFGEEK